MEIALEVFVGEFFFQGLDKSTLTLPDQGNFNDLDSNIVNFHHWIFWFFFFFFFFYLSIFFFKLKIPVSVFFF